MPHSLKVRLKNLQRKGELTEKDIDRIFKALEQEPCDDVVSRQAVLDVIYGQHIGGKEAVEHGLRNTYAGDLREIADEIIALPSVRPQEQTGHWSRKTKVDAYDIAGVKTWGIKCQCDKCDFTTIVVEDFGYYKFCPNCGCRMVEESEVRDEHTKR